MDLVHALGDIGGYGMAMDAVGYGDLWGTDPLLLEM